VLGDIVPEALCLDASLYLFGSSSRLLDEREESVVIVTVATLA